MPRPPSWATLRWEGGRWGGEQWQRSGGQLQSSASCRHLTRSTTHARHPRRRATAATLPSSPRVVRRALMQALSSPVGGVAGHFFPRGSVIAAGCLLWAVMELAFSTTTSLWCVPKRWGVLPLIFFLKGGLSGARSCPPAPHLLSLTPFCPPPPPHPTTHTHTTPPPPPTHPKNETHIPGGRCPWCP